MTELEKQDIEFVATLDYDWGKLRGKTVFISGGTGFIGGFLIDVFRYRNACFGDDIKVVACSRRKSGTEGEVEYIAHDITLPLDSMYKADYIIHLASNTHPAQYGADPIGTITANVFGTYHLLNFAKECGAKFMLASSVEIYGEGNVSPVSEVFCGYLDCNTARAGYNEAKRVSESLCQSFAKQYGVRCVIARLARIFGADKKTDSKALAQFMRKAVNREDIVLKSKGLQRYSYCYIADAVSGILKILLDGQDGMAYNVSDDDDGMTLADIAKYIASLSGGKIVFDIADDADASKSQYALIDCSRLKALGWKPAYRVRDALKRTYEILTEHK